MGQIKKYYNKEKMYKSTEMFLEALGVDWKKDPNLKDTPKRCSDMWEILLGGYDKDPREYLKMFPAKSDDMVTLTNVPIYTFCAHHLILAFGKIHIGYVPNKKIVGVSKLVRFARVYAKRLNLQENLTQDIADALMKHIKPKGVIVKIELSHTCMIIRGVRSQGAVMSTEAKRGIFNQQPKLVEEFHSSLKYEGVFSY